MSDVLVAPPPAPPAPDVPSPSEVVINQNPVSSPQPVGPQAPPAPEKPPTSRREAIQQAFDRAQKAKPAPKAADAKAGHNKPPEETPEEGIDLKKPPREIHREGGRFAKAPQAEPGVQPGATPGQQQQPQQRAPQLPDTAPYRDPPPRMADHAKAEWAAAPESVRGEVHRMAAEFDGAYRRYRGDHETMNSIRHFHDMATQHGTTLDRALHNYVSMETKLRGDVVGGLDVIVNNLNLRTSDGHKLGLRDIAYHVLNQSPEQLKLMQQSNAQQASSQQLGALHQELNGLKSQLQQLHTGLQFNHTRSAVDQFADTHPRFDELGDLIEQELQFGFDLQTAYQRAERLRPSTTATHAAQTRTPPAQTRPDKSISGAPDTGPSDGQRRDGKPIGRRDAIQDAIRRVQGGV
jgi:hypothetical protein